MSYKQKLWSLPRAYKTLFDLWFFSHSFWNRSLHLKGIFGDFLALKIIANLSAIWFNNSNEWEKRREWINKKQEERQLCAWWHHVVAHSEGKHGCKENNSCSYILNTLRDEFYQTAQSFELIVNKVKKGLMITIGSFLILRPFALPRDDAEVYDVSLPHFFFICHWSWSLLR